MSEDYTFVNAFEYENRPRRPRKPRRPGAAPTPSRITNYWGTQSAPRPVTPGLIREVQSSETLQEFFNQLLEKRQADIKRRVEQRAYNVDEERDTFIDNQAYEAQHQYDMEQLGFGEAAKDGEPYNLAGLFKADEFKPSYREKGLKKSDPTYGIRTKDLEMLAGAGLQGEELSKFLTDLSETKTGIQQFKQESRDYERADFDRLEGRLSRYATKHQNRIERLALQNGVTIPEDFDLSAFGDGSSESPVGNRTVEDLFGKKLSGSASFGEKDDEETPSATTSAGNKEIEDLIGTVLEGEATVSDKNMFMEAMKDKSSWGASRDTSRSSVQADGLTSLMWALDKVSRPLYAVNSAAREWYRLDSDTDKDKYSEFGWDGTWKGIPIVPQLHGKNPLDSLDDLSVGGVISVMAAGALGFADGGLGNASDPVLTSDIIAENAKRDPAFNVYDTSVYRHGAGFIGDVVLDPLSYVGLGIGTSVTRSVAAKAYKAIKPLDEDLMKTSKEVADELKDVDPYLDGLSPSLFDAGKPVEAETVYKMLGGNNKYWISKGQKSKAAQEVGANVDHLSRLLERQAVSPSTSGSQAVRELAQSLSQTRQRTLDGFKDDVFIETLRKELGPIGKPMEEFDDLLTTARVTPHIATAFQHYRKTEELIEETFNITKSVEKNGRTIKRTAHQNVLSEIERLRTAGKTSKADEMQFKLDEIQNRLEERPLHELIPELKADYRLNDDDIKDLFRDSQSFMARSGDSVWQSHYNRVKVLDKDIRTLKGRIAREEDPKKLQRLEGQLASTYNRRSHASYQRDMVQADVVVRLLNHKIIRKQGLKTYTNPEKARVLHKELDALKAERQGLSEGKGSTGDDIALNSREQEIKLELKSLEGPEPSKPDLLTDVPTVFRTSSDGAVKLNVDKLKKHIIFDKYTGHFRLERTGDEATDKWLQEVRHSLDTRYQDNFHDRLKRILEPARKEEQARNKNFKINDEYEDLKNSIAPSKKQAVKRGWSKEYSQAHYKGVVQARNESSEYVFKEAALAVERGTLNSGKLSSKFKLENAPVSEQEIIRALKWKQGDEKAQKIIEANTAKRGAGPREVDRIDRELKDLDDLHKAQVAAERKAWEEAKQARVVLDKRLKEDAILRIAEVKFANQKKGITLNTWGNHELFTIPGTASLFKAAEKIGGIDGVKSARQHWADAFVSPTSRLPEEMRAMRGRALSEPHVVIKATIEALQKNFKGHDVADRQAAFRTWRNESQGELHPETQKAIDRTFNQLLPYFRNEVKIGGQPLTLDEINKYLIGYGVKVQPIKGGIKTSRDLVRSVQVVGTGTKKRANRDVGRMVNDPMELAWNIHVAKELAMARKGLIDNVTKEFGVRRGIEFGENGKALTRILDDETTTVIEKLKKQYDWTPVERAGNNHLFPPEIAPDIERLFDMLEPASIQDFARLFDRATSGWKMMTTIYNPAYWTRNGMGEAMSSWLAGVNTYAPYRASQKLIQYARHDSKDFEAVADKLPGIKVKKNEDLGREIATTTKSGIKVSIADVWAMAHDTGIKTNFFDTEFSRTYSNAGNRIRTTKVGEKALGLHNKMRHGGEWYEDYWRMAHFIDSINKSNKKTLKEAAADAAGDVRKYHFDYTDFTQLEKAVLLRAFPFYKWTRKALPLMVGMMFTKPGKVMGYNKLMNSTSNGINGVENDTNGFAPNYSNMVPDWIKSQWAYQIGTDAMGLDTYMNIATPQMDSYKALTNPVGTATGLLNPFIKFPIDEVRAMKGKETMGSIIGKDDPFEHDLGTRDPLEFADLGEIMNYTPITKLLKNLGKSKGNYLKNNPEGGNVPSEEIMKFLTGLGIYEDKGF